MLICYHVHIDDKKEDSFMNPRLIAYFRKPFSMPAISAGFIIFKAATSSNLTCCIFFLPPVLTYKTHLAASCPQYSTKTGSMYPSWPRMCRRSKVWFLTHR